MSEVVARAWSTRHGRGRRRLRHRHLGSTGLVAVLTFALALLGPLPAHANHWRVVPEQSEIRFLYQRNGQPAEGRFRRFRGIGHFDRSDPGAATFDFHVESASIDLGRPAESAFATSAEWFDAKNHPEVVYRLLRLTPEGGERYRAEGELTIRGHTRPVVTTVALKIGDGWATAAGRLTVDRKDFGLGYGPSALFVKIGREVTVEFRLCARPRY